MRKSITKTIRIRACDLEYVEGIMEREQVTWSGAFHHIIGKARESSDYETSIMQNVGNGRGQVKRKTKV